MPKFSPQALLLLILPVGGIIAAIVILNMDAAETSRTPAGDGFPTPPAVTFIPPTSPPLASPTVPPAQESLLEKPVPDITLATLGGETIRLDEYTDEVVFLNFWATWCIPCQEEMPALQQLQDEYGGEGVHVIAVTDPTAGQTEDDIRAFIESYDLTMTIALSSDEAVYQQFGAVQIPITFIIDQEGVVRYRQVGVLDADDIAVYLDRLLP